MAPSMEAMCRDLARMAGERLRLPAVFVGGIPWQARERRFLDGSIDILWICGLPYVWNDRDANEPAHLLAAPVMQAQRYGDRPVYFSDIVVRRDSGRRRFEDLRGARFVYNEPRSHSGYNVMRHHLAWRGLNGGFFRDAVESGAHQRSIAWILARRADVAAVDSTVLDLEFYRRPRLRADLDVIGTLGPSPMPPWIARPGLAADLRAAVRQFLLGLHEDAEGRALLTTCHMARFADVGDTHYDPIRRMAREAAHVVL